jgi:uncharacterized membrane protein YeaQ/YmgE (transglycosylase-associated protein family)
VGVIGGLLGGWLAGQLFNVKNAVNGINAGSILVAFLGAVLVIVIARAFQGRGGSSLLHR